MAMPSRARRRSRSGFKLGERGERFYPGKLPALPGTSPSSSTDARPLASGHWV